MFVGIVILNVLGQITNGKRTVKEVVIDFKRILYVSFKTFLIMSADCLQFKISNGTEIIPP